MDGSTESMDVNLGNLREMVSNREAWHAAIRGVEELDTTWKLNNKKITRFTYDNK